MISKYIKELSIHKVDAMPNRGNFDIGHGLDTLLSAWKYVPSYVHMDTTYNVDYALKAEFNKLHYKLAGER